VNEEVLSPLRELVGLVAKYRKRGRAYILQSHGIDLTEWDEKILRALYARSSPKMTFREVADVLSQDRDPGQPLHSSTISQCVSRLEQKFRLVATNKLEKDRPKNFQIWLTDDGHRLVRAFVDTEELIVGFLAKSIGLGGETEEPQQLQQQFIDVLRRAVATFHLNTRMGTRAGFYDCLLGGSHHTVFDHDVAAELMQKNPYLRGAAIANRAFLRRAVQYLISNEKVTQFIDIGAGLPTAGNTHEVALTANPDAKVLYVDNDRNVVLKSREILSGARNVKIIEGDLTKPEGLLSDPECTTFIDFSQPVAIILVAVVHFLDESQATHSLRVFRERLPAGGFLVLSHGVREDLMPDIAEIFASIYREHVGQVFFRSRKEIDDLLRDVDLVKPGLVYTPEWHSEIRDDFLPPNYVPPGSHDGWQSLALAAVGRMRTPTS
jgi:hypothetical protein